MKQTSSSILTLVVIGCIVVLAHCGDHDHFDRHQKGGHRFHSPHRDRHPGGLKLRLQERGNAKNETVAIDVIRTKNDVDGSKSNLKVNLRIHIIQGNVHINGKKIDHAVVTAIHLRTSIDEVFQDGRMQTKRALVTVRVMVTEQVNTNGVKQLAVQEEITEIDGETVSQIEIKEVVFEMADKLNESKRTITSIKIKESKIHKKEKAHDKEIWACKGRLPNKPYHLNKEEMRKLWRIHNSHNKQPQVEIGENDDGNIGDRERQHGREHDRHKRWGRRFCSWFHKLPIGTRVVFCISVILFGVFLAASCYICMCKKTRREMPCPEKKRTPSESGSEILDMEACPLPEKKALDKQPLIA